MKLAVAIRDLHRAEKGLVRDLLTVSDRHRAEHEVHYVARDLAGWSAQHVRDLAAFAPAYGLRLDGEVPGSAPTSPPRDEPGLVLLADLRRLHLAAAGVSLDWELVAQGAQAVKDATLLDLAQRRHPRTLRQLTWTNAMLKTLSPQILAG